MDPQTDHGPSAEMEIRRRHIRGAGVGMFVIGALVLVGGFVLIQSLTADLRATITLTRTAVATIDDTVAMAADLADGATDAVASASDAAADAAATTRTASDGMTALAEFLEVELAENIDAIGRALPGAIGAAGAIDSTLGALSFFGLDYSPEERFADSLRRIQTAFDDLPEGIREQSEMLATLAPSAGDMASDVAALADDMAALSTTFEQMDELSEQYATTLTEADTAVTEMASSLDRTIFLLRLVVVVAAVGALLLGFALISVDRVLGLLMRDRQRQDPVVVARTAASGTD